MMVAMGVGTLVRTTDFAMVGDLGPSALAAVGVGGQFYWAIESILMIAHGGLVAIMARAVGAGDEALAADAFRQAQLQGIVLGLAACALVYPFTAEAIGLFGVDADVVALGDDYLWWRLPGTVPLSIAMVFGAALRSAGDVRTPLWAALGAGAVNLFGNWVLIYGHLGFPALGVTGAAIASNLAMTVMALHFIVLWQMRRLVLKPGGGRWRPDGSLQRRLFRVGLPVGAESGLFQLGLMVFQRVMAGYGTNVIAAYNVASMLLGYSFIPGVGFSVAASTLVGQNLGARDPDAAERAGWRSNRMAILAMAMIGAALALGARPIAAIFTADPELTELVVTILWILGAAHPFMAIEFALGGALRGAGDTLFPMITVFSGLVVVRLGLAFALVELADAPIEAVWGVLIVDYVVKSIMFVARFRAGGWKRRRV